MSKKLINGKILSIQLGREETRIVLVGKNSEILHGITVPTPAGAVEDGMITLWPHQHGTDGFFISKLRKGE